jgi:Anti-sigma factor NepR
MRSVEARDDTIAAEIGTQLRGIYDDVLREPLPDNISKLMERLVTGKVVPLPIGQQFKADVVSLRTAELFKAADNYNWSARRRRKIGLFCIEILFRPTRRNLQGQRHDPNMESSMSRHLLSILTTAVSRRTRDAVSEGFAIFVIAYGIIVITTQVIAACIR